MNCQILKGPSSKVPQSLICEHVPFPTEPNLDKDLNLYTFQNYKKLDSEFVDRTVTKVCPPDNATISLSDKPIR